MYPSTTTALPVFAIAARARSIPYSVLDFRYSSPSGELTYFARCSSRVARPPSPCIRPRASLIGNMMRARKWSMNPPFCPFFTRPAAAISSTE